MIFTVVIDHVQYDIEHDQILKEENLSSERRIYIEGNVKVTKYPENLGLPKFAWKQDKNGELNTKNVNSIAMLKEVSPVIISIR